jgi:hypothetical protein
MMLSIHPTTDPRVRADGIPITASIKQTAKAMIISMVEVKVVPCVSFFFRRKRPQSNRGKKLV